MAVQQSSELVLAEADAGRLGQVRAQPCYRPGGEAVPQRQRVGQHGPSHLAEKIGRGPAGSPRRLDRPQGAGAALAVQASDSNDRVGAAPQVFGDRRDRVAEVGLEDDQAVPKDFGGLGGEAQAIEFVPLPVRELDAPTHAVLLAAPPPENTKSCLG